MAQSALKQIVARGLRELGYEVAKLLGKKIVDTASAMQAQEARVVMQANDSASKEEIKRIMQGGTNEVSGIAASGSISDYRRTGPLQISDVKL